MAIIQINTFGGEVPVQGIRNLPPTSAVEALNTWLYSGELRAIHPNVDLRTIASTTKKVFRIPLGTVGGDPSNPGVIPSPSYLGDSTWLEFIDADTDIVRGPLVGDKFKRWYFCSPTTGLRVNSLARLQAGQTSFAAGVPAPVTPISVDKITALQRGQLNVIAHSMFTVPGATYTPPVQAPGGAAVAPGAVLFETRAYAYTWVNIWGEESGPSPAVTAAGDLAGAWYLSLINDPDLTTFNDRVNYDHKVLYRTITSTQGVSTYFRVATIPAGQTTYVDGDSDTLVSGNLQFDNANGSLPPVDIQGIVSMPNGFFMGWHDSDVYFSEPYKVWSWPPEYIVSTEFPIVGMGVFGQSCCVLTQGYPEIVTGISPASTALQATHVIEPCLSRGGIVANNDAVLYPSPNGLMSISAAGALNTTVQLITKEEWLRDFTPQYLRATRYQQGYLALRCIPVAANRTAFMLDLTSLNVAVNELSEFASAANVIPDVWSAEVFTLKSSHVYHHDPSDSDLFLPFRWKSKEFQYVKPDNFNCYEIFWDKDRFDGTSTDAPTILAPGVPMHLRVYADRRLVYDADVPFNGQPNKLPSGFKATTWQFEITGRAPAFVFQCASTVKELASA